MDNKMDNKNNKSNKFYLYLLSVVIGLSIIISTLIYVNYNRYEYFSGESEDIVFDKLTGKKYHTNTFAGNP
ncbi:hypothetical protein JYG23_07180 [Sedimentibacter sp. zth1]|uniref:hypothetical protein n=1 Tax=Sedimentibacter sp. zth1 TaxID=2816908 RepID=UPI001A92D0F2|nr:hypothetical protein [Sedimentibacter sp. zth1]QSX07118.1 hypothetical protein JYG23_07180 [Sedimentibacter sp. zth1]